MSRRVQIAAIYGAGVLQGAAFVLVPSLGKILTEAPYHYSAAAYGALYFPEIGGAVLGALAAARLQRRAGSPAVLRSGLIANGFSMALLVLASYTQGRLAYAAILAETLCLGLGFGLTLATLNPYAALLFSRTPATAVTVLNGLVGAATALAPLALRACGARGSWGAFPLMLLFGFALLLFVAPPPHRAGADQRVHRGMFRAALAVLIYAVVEGSLSSWAQVYVGRVHHGDAFAATLALSVFWAAMTAARLLLGFVPERGGAQRVLFALSAVSIGVSLATLGLLSGVGALVAGYAVAGAACSIYYPYAMAFGLRTWPRQSVALAGLLVAALMSGEGIGSLAPAALQLIVSLPGMYLSLALLALPLAYFAWTLPRQHPQQS